MGQRTLFLQAINRNLIYLMNLDRNFASQFMQLIGILWWVIELGHVDIFVEVSILSQYQANPRLGHLEVTFHIFLYLKRHPDMGHIVYDSVAPVVDKNVFSNNAHWTDFYGEVKEELAANMPEPCGNMVTISAFIDANHAGNGVTCHSYSGILIFVQNAPIIWFAQRQNTVKDATFGSELVAMRIAKDLKMWVCDTSYIHLGYQLMDQQMYFVTIVVL